MNRKIDIYLWRILFVVVALFVIAIRIRLLGIPLERDEGEYAYAGQLMLRGVAPYQLAYNMKFPGTYAAYAILMSIFGQTPGGIHLGLLLVNAATIALIFFLARRLLGEIGALAAASSYAVLSVSPTVLGFAGHATHFVVFFAVAGLLVQLVAQDRQSTLWFVASGLLLGASAIMKQPGIVFIGFGFIYLCFCWWRQPEFWKQAGAFVVGAALPFLITFLLLWRAGVFARFWFWSVDYARTYGARISLGVAGKIFAAQITSIIGSSAALWALAAIGVVVVLLSKAVRFNRMSFPRGFLFLYLISSVAATSAGFYFRPHYFILVLPALALLVGVTMSIFPRVSAVRAIALVVFFSFALALPIYAERDFFFERSMTDASRLTSGLNPFPESQRIADFLRQRTSPNDTIAVLGSEPQIYFLAQRRSATGYIYMYPLMEPQPFAAQMQQEMIREIEKARPKFVVFVAIHTSWLDAPESSRAIFDWLEQYSASNLKPAGLVNLVSAVQTDYYLPYTGEAVVPAPLRITIYERKS